MNICITIPTYRKEIEVLKHFEMPYPVLIISDPDTHTEHHDSFALYSGKNDVAVLQGVKGMSAQVAECYKKATLMGFDWFFRLDDDLGPKSFLHKDGHYPTLKEVIDECAKCAEETKTSLVGLNNTMNRHWMHDGYGRTYGLIHGGAHLCKSSPSPEEFIDTRIQYYEDVYRSLAHRRKDGAVGRVKHIGIDKSGSTQRVEQARDKHAADIALILETFPGMVTCEGTKEINNGQTLIANWRYKKTPKAAREEVR